MSTSSNLGHLMRLYMTDIDCVHPIDTSQFLINTAAEILIKTGGRNWLPVIVQEIPENRYQVIGNFFTYAVVKAAKLDRIWCIIADATQEIETLTRILSREITPKINLSMASKEQIRLALEYLSKKNNNLLKGVNLAKATDYIYEASDRKYWTTFEPITRLKCGITKGKKLDSLQEIFELTPEAKPEVIIESQPKPSPKSSQDQMLDLTDVIDLRKLTVAQLKDSAKKKGIKVSSRIKKADLIKLLSSA